MVERAYQCRKKHSSFLEYGLLVLLILMLLGAIVTLGVFYSIGEQGYPAPLPPPNPFLPRASHVPERSQPCRVGQRVGVCQGSPPPPAPRAILLTPEVPRRDTDLYGAQRPHPEKLCLSGLAGAAASAGSASAPSASAGLWDAADSGTVRQRHGPPPHRSSPLLVRSLAQQSGCCSSQVAQQQEPKAPELRGFCQLSYLALVRMTGGF